MQETTSSKIPKAFVRVSLTIVFSVGSSFLEMEGKEVGGITKRGAGEGRN